MKSARFPLLIPVLIGILVLMTGCPVPGPSPSSPTAPVPKDNQPGPEPIEVTVTPTVAPTPIPVSACGSSQPAPTSEPTIPPFTCTARPDATTACTWPQPPEITVIIPDQSANHPDGVCIQSLPIDYEGAIGILSAKVSDFWPLRVIANFEIRDNRQGIIVSEFAPPITIAVLVAPELKATLEQRGLKMSDLRLAFWDQDKAGVFISDPAKGMIVSFDETTGEVIVRGISSWGDSHIIAGY